MGANFSPSQYLRQAQVSPYRDDLKQLLSKVPDKIGDPDNPPYRDGIVEYYKDGCWFFRNQPSGMRNYSPLWGTDSRKCDFAYLAARGVPVPEVKSAKSSRKSPVTDIHNRWITQLRDAISEARLIGNRSDAIITAEDLISDFEQLLSVGRKPMLTKEDMRQMQRAVDRTLARLGRAGKSSRKSPEWSAAYNELGGALSQLTWIMKDLDTPNPHDYQWNWLESARTIWQTVKQSQLALTEKKNIAQARALAMAAYKGTETFIVEAKRAVENFKRADEPQAAAAYADLVSFFHSAVRTHMQFAVREFVSLKSAKRSSRKSPMSLSAQARTGLMIANHPSRLKRGLPISIGNQKFIEELVEAGYGKVDGSAFHLNAQGMQAAQALVDSDVQAATFYGNINKSASTKITAAEYAAQSRQQNPGGKAAARAALAKLRAGQPVRGLTSTTGAKFDIVPWDWFRGTHGLEGRGLAWIYNIIPVGRKKPVGQLDNSGIEDYIYTVFGVKG